MLLLAGGVGARGEKQGQKIVSCPMHQPWALASQPIELEKHHDALLDALLLGSVVCIALMKQCNKMRSVQCNYIRSALN